MLRERYWMISNMAQMVSICELCGKRMTFPAQLAETSLACPFCGHLTALPKSLRPPPPPRTPGVPAAGGVIRQTAGAKGLLMAVTIGCCLIAGAGIIAGLIYIGRSHDPGVRNLGIRGPVSNEIPSASGLMPVPTNAESADPSTNNLAAVPVVPQSPVVKTDDSPAAPTSNLPSVADAAPPTPRTPDAVAPEPATIASSPTATNAGVSITPPTGGQNAPAPFSNGPVNVIVRVNEFASLSTGPWVISLSLGEDFGNYHCVFVDFRAKPVAAQVRQTGGTINKIIGLEYIMPPLGLTARVMSSGISIERAKGSTLAIPIGSLLTFIRIVRAGADDIIIWIRGLDIAGCQAKETESGFAVSVPRKAIPDAWRFVLNTNAIECHASFKGLARPEVFDFQITETPSNLVVNLMIDKSRRDTIWEAMQAGETMPVGTAHASPGAGSSAAPDEPTIASASATLRFCEKAKPDEAMLVITTQPEGKP